MTADGTVDLASRAMGGSVVAANDELFAEKENLIMPGAPTHDALNFGHKGQRYDGWETRRRRAPGRDWAIVRLGLGGVIDRVVVDTAFFAGNYAPEISVEGCGAEGYPSPQELKAADWTTVVGRSAVAGDAANEWPAEVEERFTHVRLCLYPDGGVARLRVLGRPVLDPRLVAGDWMDLAALANGAVVTDCSDRFFGLPSNLISPGRALTMGDGWETARRRDDGNDWVEVRLAGPGMVELAELDTTHFVGNAPGSAALAGHDLGGRPIELLARTRLQPDTRHLLRVGADQEVAGVRLDIFPDGGMARLRLNGSLSPDGREALALRWCNLLPAAQAEAVLDRAAGDRPLDSLDSLPVKLREQLFAFSDRGKIGG